MAGSIEPPLAPSLVETVFPLTQDMRGRLYARLPSYTWPAGRWTEGPDPRRVVFVIWRTGMHPAVLAEPRRFHVVVHDGVVEWKRPKTHAQAGIRLHVDIRAWAEEFFLQLPERVGHVAERVSEATGRDLKDVHQGYLFYTRMVQKVGDELGLPGLSPRTLRHTFIADLVDAGVDFRIIARLAGTSVQVIFNYSLTREIHEDPIISLGKWGIPSDLGRSPTEA